MLSRLGAGGAERMAVNLANALVERDHTVQILTALPDEALTETVAPAVERRCLDLSRTRLRLSDTLPLRAALREYRPEVAVGFLYVGNRHGLVAARLAGVPLVLSSLQNTYRGVPRRAQMLDRWCFRFAHRGVAISAAVRNFYRDEWGFPASKLVIVPNSVPVAAIPCRDATLRQQVRAELDLADDVPALVTVASLTEQKGHAYLLDAAARLRGDFPSLRWFLVGRGPLQAAIEAQRAALGLEQTVTLLGVRSDVPKLLQGMDLFCLPSLWEGFGIATAEAMAAGLPVVATAVDGTSEVVAEGETGWLVPARDSAALAAALAAALSDPAQAVAMGLAGRQRVEAKFDLAAVVDQFTTLFTTELAGRAAT